MNHIGAAFLIATLVGLSWVDVADGQPTPAGVAGLPPSEAPLQPMDGEDLGQRGEDPHRLAIQRAARQMMEAQRLLAQRQTSRETQGLQAAVSFELQRLIADLETASSAKASGGGSPSDARNDNTGASGSSDVSDPPMAQGPQGDTPKRSATPEEAKIWGHLPQRLRQRMRTAGVEEFLPQYEQMLEEYYRRLSQP